MATRAELALVATFRDKASAQVARLRKEIGRLEKDVAKSGRMFGGAGGVLGVGAGGMAALAFKAGAAFNEMRDRAERAFTVMLGDGAKANKMLDDIADVSERTSFTFGDLTKASQRLLAFGFKAEDVLPTLEAVGGAVTAMGGSQEAIQRVTLALGQMKAKGKASAEEMLQLAEAGIPAWSILSERLDEVFGPERAAKMREAQARMKDNLVTKLMGQGMSADAANERADEMMREKTTAMMMKLAEQGKLPADKVIAALRAGMNKKFGKLANLPDEEKTLGEKLEMAGDKFSRVMGKLTKGPLQAIGRGVLWVVKALDWLDKVLDKMTPGQRDFLGWATSLALALISLNGVLRLLRIGFGPLAKLLLFLAPIGKMFSWLGRVLKWIWPVLSRVLVWTRALPGWLKLIGIAVALLAIAWEENWLGIRDALKPIVDWIGDRIQDVIDAVESVIGPFEDLPTNIANAGASILAAVGDLWNSVTSGVAAFGASLVDKVTGAFQSVLDTIDILEQWRWMAIDKAWALANDLPGFIWGMVSSVTDRFWEMYNTVRDLMGWLVQDVVTTVQNWGPAFIDSFKAWVGGAYGDAFAWFYDTAIPFLRNIVDGLIGVVSDGGALSRFINSFKEWVGQAYGQAFGWFDISAIPYLGEIVRRLVDTVSDPAMLTKFIQAFKNWVGNAYGQAFGWFNDTAVPFVGKIVKDLVDKASDPSMATKFIDSFKNWVGNAYGQAFAWFDEKAVPYIGKIVNDIVGKVSDPSMATKFIQAFKDWVTPSDAALAKLKEAFDTLYSNVLWVVGQVQTVLTALGFESIPNTINNAIWWWNYFKDQLISIKDTIVTTINVIIGKVRALWDALRNIGSAANPANIGFSANMTAPAGPSGMSALAANGAVMAPNTARGSTVNNFYLNAEVVTTTDAQAWWRKMQDESRLRGAAVA